MLGERAMLIQKLYNQLFEKILFGPKLMNTYLENCFTWYFRVNPAPLKTTQ